MLLGGANERLPFRLTKAEQDRSVLMKASAQPRVLPWQQIGPIGGLVCRNHQYWIPKEN
jgi:hypothetical protein